MIRDYPSEELDGFIERGSAIYVPETNQIVDGLTADDFGKDHFVIFRSGKKGKYKYFHCPTFEDAIEVMRDEHDGKYSDVVWYYENRFSTNAFCRLFIGCLVPVQGFSWSEVDHFRLIDDVLHAYGEDRILPGPGFRVKIIPLTK